MAKVGDVHLVAGIFVGVGEEAGTLGTNVGNWDMSLSKSCGGILTWST